MALQLASTIKDLLRVLCTLLAAARSSDARILPRVSCKGLSTVAEAAITKSNLCNGSESPTKGKQTSTSHLTELPTPTSAGLMLQWPRALCALLSLAPHWPGNNGVGPGSRRIRLCRQIISRRALYAQNIEMERSGLPSTLAGARVLLSRQPGDDDIFPGKALEPVEAKGRTMRFGPLEHLQQQQTAAEEQSMHTACESRDRPSLIHSKRRHHSNVDPECMLR